MSVVRIACPHCGGLGGWHEDLPQRMQTEDRKDEWVWCNVCHGAKWVDVDPTALEERRPTAGLGPNIVPQDGMERNP